MKLHFLGTTGYHPNDRRQTACLMLPQIGTIFDAGTAMYRTRDLIETDTLDIYLSHIHLDHCIGLTFLYDVLHDKPMQRVTVHVEASKIKPLREHLYAKELFPVEPNFEIKPLPIGDAGTLSDGSRLTTFPLTHPGGSIGFRVDGSDSFDGSLAYVTDTTADPTADYVKHLTGVNTLIHECYFSDGREELADLTGHSCLTPVAEVAAAAGAGSLHLVHINPLTRADPPLDLSTVEPIFANTFIAADQEIIEV